jgi:hypothetical protein
MIDSIMKIRKKKQPEDRKKKSDSYNGTKNSYCQVHLTQHILFARQFAMQPPLHTSSDG